MKFSFRRLTLAASFAAVFAIATLALIAVSSVVAQQTPTTTTSSMPAARDEKLYQQALKLHRASIVIDGHNDITSPMTDKDYDLATPSVGKYHTDIARMKQGGLSAQFFSIYVGNEFVKQGHATSRAMDLIDVVYRAAEKYPNDFLMAFSVADIRRAKKANKIAALMGIENGAAIDNSLKTLREFYRLGIRYMTLTHNFNNDWADSGRDTAKHNGLSDFGKEVVREMNRLGMMIDVSHVSDKTMSDVLDITKPPVIASHSSARALANHPRNIPDDLLKRIAQNGGVVMVNFYPTFIDQKVYDADKARTERLKPQYAAIRETYKDNPARIEEEIDKLDAANPLPETPLSVLIDHIEHIAKVAGVDHVGLGSDFDGVPTLPNGMKDIAQLPNITYELLDRGFSEKDVKKILGENLLRVMADNERIARASSKTISGDGSLRKLEVVK
ncbi:MAG: dipeptidase [Pyrinomonadaceae bacterium MAG19_C2-C3]|nr:dipeptidase [Pyrinomonadaceae bacterium MAG19_C2-C3]